MQQQEEGRAPNVKSKRRDDMEGGRMKKCSKYYGVVVVFLCK